MPKTRPLCPCVFAERNHRDGLRIHPAYPKSPKGGHLLCGERELIIHNSIKSSVILRVLCGEKNKKGNVPKKHIPFFVHPMGIEPISSEPESGILSIELRVHPHIFGCKSTNNLNALLTNPAKLQ